MGFIQVGKTTVQPYANGAALVNQYLPSWQNYAQTNLNNAVSELGKLGDIINSISVSPSGVSVNVPTPNFSLNITDLSIPDISPFSPGDAPTQPTPQIISAITAAEAPQFNDLGVTYEDPQVPGELSFTLPTKPGGLDPGTVPEIQEYQAPTAPTYSEPALPSLQEVTIPTVPTISINDFTGTVPDYRDLDVENSIERYSDPGYTSSLYSEIAAYLDSFTDLISEQVQKALDNEERQNRRVRFEAQRSTPAGWARPPEVAAARELYAEQETMLRLSGATREILINEVTQLRQWVVQIFSLLQQQDTLLASIYNQQQDRQVQVLIATTDGFVKIHNAAATVFNAKVALFNAEIAQHRTLLDTELARLDAAIKAIEAEKVKSEENSQRLQQYQLQWAAIQTQAQIYGQNIQNAINNLEGDRLAIQAFGEKVKAVGTIASIWQTEVQAAVSENEAKARGFAAHQDGQRAKADFIRANSQQFQAQMDGYRSEIAAAKQVLDGDIEKARITQQNYSLAIQAYEAALRGESGRVQAEADIARARAQAHDSNVRGKIAEYEADVKQFEAELQAAVENARIELESAKIDMQNAQNQLQATLAAQESLAKNYAQIGASALSAVNLGASASESLGWGWRASHSYSTAVTYDQV